MSFSAETMFVKTTRPVLSHMSPSPWSPESHKCRAPPPDFSTPLFSHPWPAFSGSELLAQRHLRGPPAEDGGGDALYLGPGCFGDLSPAARRLCRMRDGEEFTQPRAAEIKSEEEFLESSGSYKCIKCCKVQLGGWGGPRGSITGSPVTCPAGVLHPARPGGSRAAHTQRHETV